MQSEEFYIGGYTEGKGSRADRFGALLVGTPAGRGKRIGKLEYEARVGSGFDERLLDDLRKRFDELKTGKHPFTEEAADRPPHHVAQTEARRRGRVRRVDGRRPPACARVPAPARGRKAQK